MSQRRFFLKKSFGGACAVLLSSGLLAPFSKKWAELVATSSPGDDNTYKVKFVYAFESEPVRASLLPKIEKISFIEAVNEKYRQSGQLLSFSHEQHDNLVSNFYVFNSQRSFQDWESEMVSAQVMDPKYCRKTVSPLSEQNHGLNKLVIIEVNSPKIA